MYHFPSKHMYIYIQGLAGQNYSNFSKAVEKSAARDSAFLIPSIVLQVNLELRLNALNLARQNLLEREKVGHSV
jgi:hypothetical protein